LSRRLEAFLAAPDSLRRDKAERAKAILRKRREEAEARQLRAGKRTDQPSVEDLIADLNRVASDPETNPWHEFKALSAKRYRLFGWYPIEHVDRQFGTFEHAKEVAGLADQAGTKAKKSARAEASRREHAGRYLSRYVHPYVAKWPDRELTKARLVLSLSDTHSGFLDPFVWFAFLRAIKDLEPDVVYLNGDIVDGSEISRHPKPPGWTMGLQDELDFAREMLRQIREDVGFEGELILGAGNHCLDRLAMYLTQVAPALAGLRTLRFDKLLDLDGLGVKLALGGTISSPAGDEGDKRGRLLHGFYRIHHGNLGGSTPALSELLAAGRSGQSGHVHRASVIYGTNEATRGLSWMTTPMGCTPKVGRAYQKGTSDGWQRGFGVAWLYPDKTVHQYPVVTDSGTAHVEGFTYRARPGMREPDPSKVWIKDWTPGKG
jgi:hypothetical protein